MKYRNSYFLSFCDVHVKMKTVKAGTWFYPLVVDSMDAKLMEKSGIVNQKKV